MKNIATPYSYNIPVCTCPHCSSASITRSGFDRGTQRYRCKTCNRTFKATAGTPVHGLHKKEKIASYLIALRKGMSVRKAARYAGISKNTSFAWRHKFLSSLEARSVVHSKSETSSASIIKLPYSAKGRRKPPEKHISPTRTLILQNDGQVEIYKLVPVKYIHHAARILSESSASYFAAMPHKTVTTGIKRAENANMIKTPQISQPLISEGKHQAEKLLGWMKRFKGVASKYLQNYWNWYATLLNLGQLKQEIEHFCKICIHSRSLHKYYIAKQI